MKILQLNLMAFGPFTDKNIDLDCGNHGLHIIYGPNEAGKSSALRALHQMLFGIPVRSADNFIHPYAKLRIGSVLKRKDGEVLNLIRRKGRGNTIREQDDAKIIEDSKLSSFLGNVDENLFSTMFGIDHPGLVKGGEDIISGGGNMGQILFAAGAGISDFRRIQSELLEDADNLFKSSGRKPVINASILEFNQTRKSMREAQLNDREWAAHDKALQEAETRKAEMETELAQKLGERNRLERIKNALPDMSRRKELQEMHEKYADAVLLPKDFTNKRRKAFEELKIAKTKENQASQYLSEIKQKLKKLDVPHQILNQARNINAIFQELGSVIKADEDKLRLEGLRSSKRADAKEILRGLNREFTLEQAEDLRLEKREIIRIQELGTQYERLTILNQGTNEAIEKLRLHIDRIKAKSGSIKNPLDTTDLEQAIERAVHQGDMEANYQSQAAEIRRAENMLHSAVKKIPVGNKSAEEFVNLEIPSPETIDSYEDRLKSTWDAVQKLEAEKNDLEKVLLDIEGHIQEISLTGKVFTDDDLQKSREKRNSGWHMIRSTLEKKEKPQKDNAQDFIDTFPPAKNLADAYELSVRYSDDLSDRMRGEAAQVAKKAGLLADKGTRIKHMTRIKEKLLTAQKENQKIRDKWRELWAETGITPASPREMRALAQHQTALSAQLSDIREKIARAEQLRNQIDKFRNEIIQTLYMPENSMSWANDSLAALVRKGRQMIEHSEKIRTQQAQLNTELEQREAELREAKMRAQKIEQDISGWRKQWADAVNPLGLGSDATPAQANVVIEDCNALFAKLKSASLDNQRINSIERDGLAFNEKVRELVNIQAPDLNSVPPKQAVAELNNRFSNALKAQSKQEELSKQEEHEEKNLRTAKNTIAEIHARLKIMCEQAGCESFEKLGSAEERSGQKQQIETSLKECESRLRKLSAGAPLNEFVMDAESTDPDRINPVITGLSEEIERLNIQKSQLDQTIGTETNELSKMDGSAKAAELEEQAQSILARLETDAEQYVRLRLASSVLSQAIERYREKNQGPILKRSNELFAHMTLGAFQGLRLEFNEKNEAVIAGVRPGTNEIVYVDGMSDGTADQLYLAVRLATLESWLDKNESMPFILDDILIKFDDKRSAATLDVLAELSKKTQVIFFTHHQHLMELAEKHIDADVLFTRNL
ncbi:AAA family ATPase [Desulfobacterales bacterium HSG17]|nr:AAA family ATPase [Desulfobacterales bacterium HSG17]